VTLPLYAASCTDVGLERPINEDACAIETMGEAGLLMVVCDGMGGHAAGEVASAIALRTILDAVRASNVPRPPAVLHAALLAADRAIREAPVAAGTPVFALGRPMGSTAVVAWVVGEACWVGWVGDSRASVFREGSRVAATEDHTIVADLVRRGMVRPEKARSHPGGHVLAQALGGGMPAGSVWPSVWAEALVLEAGDWLVLCSDGLCDMVPEGEWPGLVEGLRYEEAARRLVDEAKARGGYDNITVVLLAVGWPTVGRCAAGEGAADRRAADPEAR
jgi:PPM family protein phosphatase